MPLPTAGLVTLAEIECRELLASEEIGRVVTSVGALPAAFPVNYRVVDDAIVFRTARGTKFEAALDRNVVAFEVDDIDQESRSGWSVLVVGMASVVDDANEVEELNRLGIDSWASDDLPHFVKIDVQRISGRRLPDRQAPATEALVG